MKLLNFDFQSKNASHELFEQFSNKEFIVVAYDRKNKEWELYSHRMGLWQGTYALNLALADLMLSDELKSK